MKVIKGVTQFTYQQLQCCLFPAIIVMSLGITKYISIGTIPRYDVLLFICIMTQLALLYFKLETKDELKVIMLFHIIGLVLEIYKVQTDRIKDKENFVKAIMFLFGFGLPDDKPAEVNGQLIVEAPSKEDGGDAAYLTNTFQESEVQVLADALISDFHKTTYVPNMNDENFMGNVSGEAMKYKLFGLLLIISIKIGYLEDGILQRLQLTANILNVKGQNVDVEGTTIKFKPHLPVNRSDIIKQIGDSQEFIPLLISLGWLDDIDNPQEILDLLQQQKEKDIELAKKAIGQTSSHNNIDDEPEEDEDDNSDI